MPPLLALLRLHPYHAVGLLLSSHPIIPSGGRVGVPCFACPRLFPPYLIRSSLPIRARSLSVHHIKRPAPTTRDNGEEDETGMCCLLASVGRAVMRLASFPHAGIACDDGCGGGGIWARQCCCLIPARVFLFSLFPSFALPPHRLLFLIRRPQLFPRPLGVGCAGGDSRLAGERAAGRFGCFGRFSCRSLTIARSLFPRCLIFISAGGCGLSCDICFVLIRLGVLFYLVSWR